MNQGADNNTISKGADGISVDRESSGSSATTEDYCYLCVVLDGNISLWKVYGESPDIKLRQVRKINACPIQQGCLWNPVRDILGVLHRDMVSLYFRHLENKGSYALPPIDSGQIRCGCWSEGGDQLVVAIGSIILIYQWPDIASCVSDYAMFAWKVPGLDCPISCMVAASLGRVVCVAEMPMEQLCTNSDMFEVPDLQNGGGQSASMGDGDVMRPSTEMAISARDALFNLSRTSKFSVNDTAQLILLETMNMGGGASKLSSMSINGILCPDLLHYDPVSGSVAVACNSRNIVQLFHLFDNQFKKLHEITLNHDERPKGVCAVKGGGFHDNQMLLMVGRLCENSQLVAPSIMADYHLRVRCFLIRQKGSKQAPPALANGSTAVHQLLPMGNPANGHAVHFSIEDPGTPPIKMPRRKRKKMHSTGLHRSKVTNCLKLSYHLDALQLPDDAKASTIREAQRTPGTEQLCDDVSVNHHKRVSKSCERIDVRESSERVLVSVDEATMVPLLENAIREQSAKIARLQQRIDEIQRLLTDVGSGSVAAVIEADGVKFAGGDSTKTDITEEYVENIDTNEVPMDVVRMLDKMEAMEDISGQTVDLQITEMTDLNISATDLTITEATDVKDTNTDLNIIETADDRITEMPDLKISKTTDVEIAPKMIDVNTDENTYENCLESTGMSEVNAQEHTVEAVNQDEVTGKDVNNTDIKSEGTDGSCANTMNVTLRKPNTAVTEPDSTSMMTRDSIDLSDGCAPQLLHLVFKVDTTDDSSAQTSKTFLLDGGRLKLDLIKQAFGLNTVELFFDGHSCVVGASADGYIPIKFVPNRTLFLTGNKV